MEQLKKLFLSFALVFVSTIMYAQTEISGTVTDATGETVIGATVMEKGTSNGTGYGKRYLERHSHRFRR